MLAIVAAFKEEVADYLRWGDFRLSATEGRVRVYRSASKPGVVVAECGAGGLRAEEATSRVIKTYRPGFVASIGFAGAAQPGLKAGDVLLCDRVMSVHGPPASWELGQAKERAVPGTRRLHELVKDSGDRTHQATIGGCLSVPTLVSDRATKARIGATFPVSVIDMEAYWVSKTAAAHGIPHGVVRSVLDPLEQTLPAFVEESLGDGTGRRWRRALGYLLARPHEARGLLKLAAQARAARASLARFLVTLTSEELGFQATREVQAQER